VISRRYRSVEMTGVVLMLALALGFSKSKLSIGIYVLSKDLGLQSLPSPRLLAEDPPSLIQGKVPIIIIIKLIVLLSPIANASVSLVST